MVRALCRQCGRDTALSVSTFSAILRGFRLKRRTAGERKIQAMRSGFSRRRACGCRAPVSSRIVVFKDGAGFWMKLGSIARRCHYTSEAFIGLRFTCRSLEPPAKSLGLSRTRFM